MRTSTVDLLLDERARLITKVGATEGHLWAAEFLLHRCAKLLPRLIAEHPADAIALDVLIAECRELLTEPRPHPGQGTVDDAHWPLNPSGGASAGEADAPPLGTCAEDCTACYTGEPDDPHTRHP